MKIERKIAGFLALALIVGCLLISCGTTTNIFDDNLPRDKSADLKISPAFTIRTYNEIPVKLKAGVFGFTGFTIPPGKTTLQFDLDTGRSFGNVRYYGNNFSITYYFKAGEYSLTLGFVDKDGKPKATNLGESYLALLLCQNDDYKNPLLVKQFKF